MQGVVKLPAAADARVEHVPQPSALTCRAWFEGHGVHRGWHVAGDVVVPEDASVVSPTVQLVFATHTAFVVGVAAAICRSPVEGARE